MKKSAQFAFAGLITVLLSSASWAQAQGPAANAPAAKPAAAAPAQTAAPAKPAATGSQASIAVPAWVVQAETVDQARDAVKIRISRLQLILQALEKMTPEQFAKWQQSAAASAAAQKNAKPTPAPKPAAPAAAAKKPAAPVKK